MSIGGVELLNRKKRENILLEMMLQVEHKIW